jgi:hypothetical protein
VRSVALIMLRLLAGLAAEKWPAALNVRASGVLKRSSYDYRHHHLGLVMPTVNARRSYDGLENCTDERARIPAAAGELLLTTPPRRAPRCASSGARRHSRTVAPSAGGRLRLARGIGQSRRTPSELINMTRANDNFINRECAR